MGVNGSNGFEINESSGFGFATQLRVPGLFDIPNIGDRLTYSIDAQVNFDENPATSFIFDLSLRGGGGTMNSVLLARNDDFNFQQILNQTGEHPLAEGGTAQSLTLLGLEDDQFGISDYFRYKMSILRQGVDQYEVTTSLSDLSGNVLTQYTSNNFMLGSVFQSDTVLVEISYGHEAEFLRVDNINYSVTSIPEPTTSTVVLLMGLTLGLRRSRR